MQGDHEDPIAPDAACQTGTATLTLEEATATGVRLLNERRLPQAEALLQAVIDADPENADALHFLGVLRAQQGRGDDAIQLIRRALDVSPQYADAWNNLGLLLRAMPHFSAALDAFDKAVEYGPHLTQAHLSRARLLRRSGRLEEAVVAFKRALELDPSLSEAHQSLGNLLHRMQRFDAATEAFRNWHQLDPGHPVAAHLAAAHRIGLTPSRASDDYVRTTFDRFAPGFDQNMQVIQYRAPQLIAAEVARWLAPNRQLHVLDAGCGTGLCGVELAPYARRLAGVDLSPVMIERARERGIYGELVVAELTEYLVSQSGKYDLIVSADTLVYFGAIEEVIAAASVALRAGGHLVFTVERFEPGAVGSGSGGNFFLNPHGRYSHGEAYLRRCIAGAELELLSMRLETLRLENELPVDGFVLAARKTDDRS
jgi:predicted TPR repeat methyltransferase